MGSEMKKLLLSLALFVYSSLAFAGINYIWSQRDDDPPFATNLRINVAPADSQDGIMSLNGSDNRSYWLTYGTGLFRTGSVLYVAPPFSSITGLPSTMTGYGITDGVSTTVLNSTLTSYASKSDLTTGLALKFNQPSCPTTQYLRGDGSCATLPTIAPAFNFSQPTARTLAASTSYQALDTTKAAIVYPSYSCQNATQVLASSACTIQVRMGTGTLTCSTGTVYYTQSLTVGLGLLLTQNSTNPVPINVPIGGSFILCPQAGTFTTTTVEQSAG